MFDQEYADRVQEMLGQSFSEREGATGRVEIIASDHIMKVTWEPGDATRYQAYMFVLPRKEDHDLPMYGVCGRMDGVGPFLQIGDPGGYLAMSYFTEKNPYLISRGGLYTTRKLCQLVAAMLHRRTNANDPPNYQEADEADEEF